MIIKKNAIRCKICGEEIESVHCHDFKWSSCGACSVDGSHQHLCRLYIEEGCFTDISICKKDGETNE